MWKSRGYPITGVRFTKSSNRTPVIGHPCDHVLITWQLGTQRTNHDWEFCLDTIIAFNKECLHSVVLIENFGLSIHGHQFGPPPKKIFRGKIIQGEWFNFHWACALFLAGVEFHVLLASWCASLSSLTFSSHLVCFLVEFWTVLPCLCSRTRSPILSDVNRGNSCIWLHLLT